MADAVSSRPSATSAVSGTTGLVRVVGVDEVGVAPTCGAVVAAAVIMRPGCHRIPGVRDSKTLSAAQRERLAPLIRARAVAVGVGAASVREIDQLNIYHATHLAMRRAIARVGGHEHVLVDGNRIAGFEAQVGPYTNIVDGDAQGLLDRLRVGRGQGRPRPDDGAARRPLPGLRLGAQPGLRHAASIARRSGALGLTPFHRRSFLALQRTLAGDQLDSTCWPIRRRRPRPTSCWRASWCPVMADDAMLDALDLASLELTAPGLTAGYAADKRRCDDDAHGGPTRRPGDGRAAQQAGDAAEALVASRLASAGWTVLARNVHVGRHELDLVAVDPGPPAALVVVEVRWRTGRGFGLPEETVDHRKRARVRAAAYGLLDRGTLPDGSPVPRLPLRFDLVVRRTRGADRHHRHAM